MALPKPEWLTIRPSSAERYRSIREDVASLGLHTVCAEAHCPNITECWDSGTATFMVLGDRCTRGCRFCAVMKGARGAAADPDEPGKLARAVRDWKLSYAVITSVCRDDLPDQGSAHFADCVREIKRANPDTLVELLIPDFMDDRGCLERIVEAGPDVVGHNIETVRRLSPTVRDRRASYGQSLDVLRHIKEIDPRMRTKSAMMLGLGESDGEVLESMRDLRGAKVDFLALGQYLSPDAHHAEVKEYVSPERFDALRRDGRGMGFLYVAAGPFVRSSYRAGEFFVSSMLKA